MGKTAPLALSEQIAAAMDWWREAGVDCSFGDEPVQWTQAVPEAEPKPAPPPPAAKLREEPPPPPPLPRIGGEQAGWPQDLPAFHEWWLSEPSLDAGGASQRIAPRGTPGAELMVLVPAPEAADRAQLLSGPEGELLGRFLGRAGVAPETVYLAAALPRRAPMVDWRGLAAAGLGEVTIHHIGLVRPARLLVLGDDILPLLHHNPAQSPANLRKINHQHGSVPVLAANSLEAMLRLPSIRKDLWQRWTAWMGG